MTKDEALKLALEAFRQIDEAMPFPVAKLAQKAIREALAQPEQEPVAWADVDLDGMAEAFYRVIEAHATKDSPFYNPVNSDAMMALRVLRGLIPAMKQYTPPQRKPLTDEEIETYRHMIDWTASWSYINFARAIEAAHGIKGEA